MSIPPTFLPASDPFTTTRPPTRQMDAKLIAHWVKVLHESEIRDDAAAARHVRTEQTHPIPHPINLLTDTPILTDQRPPAPEGAHTRRDREERRASSRTQCKRHPTCRHSHAINLTTNTELPGEGSPTQHAISTTIKTHFPNRRSPPPHRSSPRGRSFAEGAQNFHSTIQRQERRYARELSSLHHADQRPRGVQPRYERCLAEEEAHPARSPDQRC